MQITLGTGLAIAGIVVLVLIVAQGWWSARKAAPRRAALGGAAATGERVEPGFGDHDGGDSTQPATPPPEIRAALPRRPQRLDALIDAIVPMTLESPVSGEFLLSHLPPSRRAGTKVFLIEGLDAETGQWEPPAAGRRYGELQAGVQLASRSGALNEIEYSEFVQKVQAFADGVAAVPDFPDMLDVVGRARELDAFAGPLDAVLTVTLRANQVAWSVGYVQQCAARLGFVAGAVPGRLVLPAAEEGAPPLLALSFDPQAALADEPQAAAVRECTLSLDVPQSDEKAEPFPAWHNAARTLADDMDASLVDDQGQPVTLHAFAAIGTELQNIYRQLESRDLGAGTPAARRLFS
ncbi:MAG: cell division protein ZipA C-terminal FtsZ-binding domain-containing protein [Rubrivivax sp.]